MPRLFKIYGLIALVLAIKIQSSAMAANSPPIVLGPSNLTVFQNSSAVPVGGLSAQDLDVGANPLLFTFSAIHGTLNLVLNGQTSNGNTFTFQADLTTANLALATLTYAPNSAYSGTDTIVIVINDQGDGGVNTPASMTKNIAVIVDSPPTITAPPDATTTPSTSTGMLGIVVGASNPSTAITVTATSSDQTIVPNGNIQLTGNSFVSVTPTSLAGTVAITLTATDLNGGSSSATFMVFVKTNSAPTLQGLSDQIIFEDTTAAQTFTIGDAETPSSLVLTGTSTDQTIVQNSGIVFTPNGNTPTVTITPLTHKFGNVTIRVTVTDPGGLTSNANFNLQILHINTAPVLNSGTATIASIPANSGTGPLNPGAFVSTFAAPIISDIDSLDPKGIAITSVDDTNGVWRYSPDAGASWQAISPLTSNSNALLLSSNALNKVQFVPNTNFAGTSTFTFRAWDGSDGRLSASTGVDVSANGGNTPYSIVNCTAKITITPINTQPSFVLSTASVTVNEDSGASINPAFVTNISPGIFASESSQTLTFNVTANSNPALFSIQPAVASNGTLTFTTATNANGTASISVNLKDNGGTANGGSDTSGVQTFSIVINPVNDAPSFNIPTTSISVIKGSGTTSVPNFATQILAGPSDEAGQSLTFIITNNSNPGLFLTPPAITSNGNLSFAENGVLGSAQITVVLKDNGGTAFNGADTSPSQIFSITVVPPNSAPSFTLLNATETVLEDAGPVSVPGFASSILPGPSNENMQNLTFLVTSLTNASLFSVQPTVDSTGTLSFTTATNANGTATFQLALMDDGGTAFGGVDTSATQLVTIVVTPVNDPPSFVIANPAVGALENSGSNTITAFATAISPGPPDEATQTVAFNIVGNTNTALFASGPSIDPLGNLTFVVAPNVVGVATIGVELQDNGVPVGTSPIQNFTITIGANNTPPTFTITQNPVTVLENSGAFLNPTFLNNVSPGLNAFESAQNVLFTVTTNSNPGLFLVQPLIVRSGLTSNANLVFVPATNQVGSATITFFAQDDGGTALGGVDTSPLQSFTIVIAPVNQQPSFTLAKSPVIVGINSGAATITGVATNILAGPPNESFQGLVFTLTSNSNPGLFAVPPTMTSNGNLSFTPTANVIGSAVLKVFLQDDGGTANGGIDTSAPQFLTITVAGAPVALNGSITVPSNGTGAGTLAGSDPLNSPPLPLTFGIVTNGNLGVATITNPATGAFTYKPNPGAVGLDTIVFLCSNGFVNSNPATEFIFITSPTISSPFASPNPATIGTHADGTYAQVTFSAMATDTINSQLLTYLWDFGDGAFGSGSTVVHHYMSSGIYTVTVSATNSSGQTVSSKLSVTIYAGIFGTGPDSDNDGFSDTLETAYGTNPNLATSHPPGDPTNPLKLNVQKLNIALMFGRTNSDSITLMVRTPFPTSIAFKGQRIAVDIGGNVVAFTLDQRLRAKSSAGTIAFSIDRAFKVFRFVLTLKKGTFSTSLASYGLVSSATQKTTVTVPLTVLFGNEGFVGLQPLTYQVRSKTGRAK